MNSKRSILIVVSRDWGELLKAAYLVQGADLQAHLAVPPQLVEAHGLLGADCTSVYRSARDVLTVVEAVHPDVVALFSGYLLAVDNPLDSVQAATLVREIQNRGILLATSDPFLGLLSKDRIDASLVELRAHSRLSAPLQVASEMLVETAHVYTSRPISSTRHASTAFANWRMLEQARADESSPLPADSPWWIFVLSAEDYALQKALYGEARFHFLLGARLADCVRQGRRAVLIAPSRCIEAAAESTSVGHRLIGLPPCPLPLFLNLALRSEFIFYWNIFSNSMLLRVLAGGSAFAFDAGHLARAMPALAALGRQEYYCGQSPVYIELGEELNAASLCERANQQTIDYLPVVALHQALPTPEQMLDRLIHDPTTESRRP